MESNRQSNRHSALQGGSCQQCSVCDSTLSSNVSRGCAIGRVGTATSRGGSKESSYCSALQGGFIQWRRRVECRQPGGVRHPSGGQRGRRRRLRPTAWLRVCGSNAARHHRGAAAYPEGLLVRQGAFRSIPPFEWKVSWFAKRPFDCRRAAAHSGGLVVCQGAVGLCALLCSHHRRAAAYSEGFQVRQGAFRSNQPSNRRSPGLPMWYLGCLALLPSHKSCCLL